MKKSVWVVVTCIPYDNEPCFPRVFASESAAEQYLDKTMRGEWADCGPHDDTGLLPYPDDWQEAQEILAARFDDGSWGRWAMSECVVEDAR